MASTKPLVLLLGSGSNIGQAVAKKFETSGYNVALAARSLSDHKISDQEWSYKLDLSTPSAVENLFVKVQKDLGIPNVVIFNAASLIRASGDHPFTVSVEDFETSLKINTISTYAAAKCAVEGFDKLPKSALKLFLYTGNLLNVSPMPMLLTLGVGKAASAHIIESGASAYATKGYRFYYIDERKEDGAPVGMIPNGQAHADAFFELASKEEQGPWQWTFVKDKGYVKFN